MSKDYIPTSIQPSLFEAKADSTELITIDDLYAFVDRHIDDLWLNKVSNNFYVLGNFRKKHSIQIMLKGEYINKVRPVSDFNNLFDRDARFGIIDHLYSIEGDEVGLRAVRNYDPKRNTEVKNGYPNAWEKEYKYIIF